MRIDIRKLKGVQKAIAHQVKTGDAVDLKGIKTIAGFDVAYAGEKAVCAAVVLDAKTMEVLERTYAVGKAEVPYVPGLLAFREGPLILQAYYDLEHDPDVLMVEGHGIAHPLKAGLASYVGVELAKPTIGVAKSILVGELSGEHIVVEGEVRGVQVKTRQYAKPVLVSPGHLVSVETAAEIARKCIVPPHKMPEPLHQAHRFADKIAGQYRAEKQPTPSPSVPGVSAE